MNSKDWNDALTDASSLNSTQNHGKLFFFLNWNWIFIVNKICPIEDSLHIQSGNGYFRFIICRTTVENLHIFVLLLNENRIEAMNMITEHIHWLRLSCNLVFQPLFIMYFVVFICATLYRINILFVFNLYFGILLCDTVYVNIGLCRMHSYSWHAAATNSHFKYTEMRWFLVVLGNFPNLCYVLFLSIELHFKSLSIIICVLNA